MDASFCQGCRDRDALIAALQARVAALQARCQEQDRLLVDLARKLQDKDLPAAAPRAQESQRPHTGRTAGAAAPSQAMAAPERVTQTLPFLPTHCERCRTPLPVEPGPEDPLPTRFQVAEVPDLKAKVTAYQRHSRTCPCCGQLNQAPLSEDWPTHSIAPGLAAVRAYLVGGCGLSKRRVEEVVETVFEVPVALGTVAQLEQEMSAALEPAHQEG